MPNWPYRYGTQNPCAFQQSFVPLKSFIWIHICWYTKTWYFIINMNWINTNLTIQILILNTHTIGVFYQEVVVYGASQTKNRRRVVPSLWRFANQKEAAKVFWRPEEAILCRIAIRSHQQERFDDHTNPQSPHHRGFFQTTSKCSFPKYVQPPKSLHLWPTQSSSHTRLSWTIFWLPPSLRSKIRQILRT